jgi:hypothetical protein
MAHRPVHTPPPAHSPERVQAFSTQPGTRATQVLARGRHLSEISAGRPAQQSADVVQSICTHSLALGVRPKLDGWQTPWMHDSPGMQSFFTEQPRPRPPRLLTTTDAALSTLASTWLAAPLDEPAKELAPA